MQNLESNALKHLCFGILTYYEYVIDTVIFIRNNNNYWIYNLIRAVFFQNLNVYLRKTCTLVVFKFFKYLN